MVLLTFLTTLFQLVPISRDLPSSSLVRAVKSAFASSSAAVPGGATAAARSAAEDADGVLGLGLGVALRLGVVRALHRGTHLLQLALGLVAVLRDGLLHGVVRRRQGAGPDE